MPPMAALEQPFDAQVDGWLELYVNPLAAGGIGSEPSGRSFRNLAAAMDHAITQSVPRPTRIHLAPGTYAGLGAYENVWRSAESPILISGALDGTGERVTIVDGGADGRTEIGTNCLRLSNVSYLGIENVHCRNAFPHGMNVDDGSDYTSPTHHIVLRNVYIGNVGLFRETERGTNSDCLKLSGVDDFHIIGSEFENCVWGEFIDMVGAHRGVISASYFHDKPLNGIQTKGGSSDILITGNVIERVQGRFLQLGGSTGTPYYRPLDAAHPARRIHVIANVLREAGVFAGRSDARSELFSLNGCADCLIAHNTAVDMQFQGNIAYIDREETGRLGNRNVVLTNNVYLMDDGAGRRRSDADSPYEYRVSQRGAEDAGEVWFLNEVAFDVADPAGNPIHLPPSLESWQFRGGVMVDPRIDPGGRPAPDSPLSGSGTSRFQKLIPGDLDGRPFGEPPSAGAFASAEAAR